MSDRTVGEILDAVKKAIKDGKGIRLTAEELDRWYRLDVAFRDAVSGGDDW